MVNEKERRMGPKINPIIGVGLTVGFLVTMVLIVEISQYPFLGIIRGLATVLGLVVVYYAYGGREISGRDSMNWLGVGFFLVSMSILVQGVLVEFDVMSVIDSMYVQTSIMVFGMMAILYAVYH